MMPSLGPLLRPPELRTTADTEEHRHATWFELFFDLVFVAAVAQLADGLAHEPSAESFLRFGGLFVTIAWAWMGFTFYANRFDTDDLVYRAVKSVAMLGVAALAVTVPDVMAGEGGSEAFALAYVAVRALLISLYVRVRRHATGAGRRVSEIYLAGFSAGASLWLVSLLVPSPARYVLWGAGLAVDLSMPPIGWAALRSAPVHPGHVTERFGLFFIIVLGEAVLAVVTGTAHVTFGLEASLVAALGFAAAVCMWWIYFDLADTSAIGRGRWGLVFVYGHFFLLGGTALLGVGVELAITHATESALDPEARWAIAIGLAAYLLSLAVFHLAAEWTTLRDRALAGRVLLAALVILVAALGGSLPPVAFMAILSAGLGAQLVLEAVTLPVGAASVWQPTAPAAREGAA
jgi:low temperature requirement protein LtrA